MSSIKETMQNFAINQALKYIEGNPDENLPKLMDMVDKFSPEGWYVEQRNAFRNAITQKNNWYQLVLKLYELDPGRCDPELGTAPYRPAPLRNQSYVRPHSCGRTFLCRKMISYVIILRHCVSSYYKVFRFFNFEPLLI